jgi:heterodisulfide reductase subunit A
MYMVKHAMLYKEHVPDGEPVIFSIDVRTSGKGYEEFYTRAKEEADILYIRGKPSRIIKEGHEYVVWATNTITGKPVRVNCDMVVLSMSMVPAAGVVELARSMRIPVNEHGFLSEVHPKLRPVESLVRGFFLAGCSQAPKDIPDTVAQASAAASKVLEMFSRREILAEPLIAWVDEDQCVTCKVCIDACPYEARELDEEKKVVTVSEALCQGCGCCVAACPTGATRQKNLDDQQLVKMVEAIFKHEEELSGSD